LKAFEEGDLMRGGGRNLPLVGVATLSLIIDVDVKASRYCSKNFSFFCFKSCTKMAINNVAFTK
jgi:hypothetical protein